MNLIFILSNQATFESYFIEREGIIYNIPIQMFDCRSHRWTPVQDFDPGVFLYPCFFLPIFLHNSSLQICGDGSVLKRIWLRDKVLTGKGGPWKSQQGSEGWSHLLSKSEPTLAVITACSHRTFWVQVHFNSTTSRYSA